MGARAARLGDVVVIGGGVSGCACAAVLAMRGIHVILVSSALDSLGQPAYGPVVSVGVDGWSTTQQVLGELPPPLRDAWLDAGMASVGEGAVVCVDRRKLSIETKRALERLPGLELRQGLVNAVESVPSRNLVSGKEARTPPRMRVGSLFGEWYEADAVVVAVGLGLRGRILAGKAVSKGGRYGETVADGLCRSLEEQGAEYVPTEVAVGSCFPGDGLLEGEVVSTLAEGPRGGECKHGLETTRMGPLRELGLGNVAGAEDRLWPEAYPESPHWDTNLRVDRVVVQSGGAGWRIVLAPDGAATGEVYVPAGCRDGWSRVAPFREGEGEPRRRVASRLEHEIRGVSVVNLDASGRLVRGDGAASAIWVSGRAGGAKGYIESLGSGVRAATSVAHHRGACDQEPSGWRPTRRPGRPLDGVRSPRRSGAETAEVLESEL